MSTAVTPEIGPDQPKQPGMGVFGHIIGMFYEPTKVFEDLAKKPSWSSPLAAYALLFAMSLVFVTVAGQKIGWEQIQANNLKFASKAQLDRLESLPPEQKAQQVRIGQKVTQFVSYGFNILRLVFWAVVALILWATFNFGLGSEMKYPDGLKILLMSCMPYVVCKAALSTVATLAIKDPETFVMQNPIGTNLGFYLNFNETSRFLYTLASEYDLFYIWALVLTAIGFSVFAKVKKGTAFGVVFGWAIVWSLIISAL